jgi:HlyD family secretion protein
VTQKASDEETSQSNGNGMKELTEIELTPEPSSSLKTSDNRTSWLSGGRGLVLGLGLGVALAIAIPRFLGSTPPEAPAEAPAEVAAAPSQSVTVAPVETAAVSRSLDATGTVAAFELIPVTSPATGLQIQQVLVREGDFVKAGQLMARLDDAVLQAQLTQARAAVAQSEAALAELRAGARSEEVARARESVGSAQAGVSQAQSALSLASQRVQRNRFLASEGAVARDRLDEVLNEERSSRANLDQAQARLREAQQQLQQLLAGARPEAITQAEAQLASARGQVQAVTAQLKETRVIAPTSGKVAERNARVGDLTSTSQKLFTIIDNGRLDLLLKVPETQLSQIEVGQRVEITSSADSKLRLIGNVRQIDPVVDEQSRQATVKVALPSDTSLRPGMFLKGAIITSSATGLTVPSQAVLPQSDGNAIVYKLQADGTVTVQPIEMGEIMPGEKVEINNGLSAGDRIVVKGAAYLKDGDRVEIVGQ